MGCCGQKLSRLRHAHGKSKPKESTFVKRPGTEAWAYALIHAHLGPCLGLSLGHIALQWQGEVGVLELLLRQVVQLLILAATVIPAAEVGDTKKKQECVNVRACMEQKGLAHIRMQAWFDFGLYSFCCPHFFGVPRGAEVNNCYSCTNHQNATDYINIIIVCIS
eukprot:scaffold63305_cov21-Tisochrysis_lutea.AAC.2